MDRRKFIQATATGIVASALSPGFPGTVAMASTGDGMNLPGLHLFSKVLQFLDIGEVVKVAPMLGFTGLDLTVRPKGHIDPDNFEHDLPAVIGIIKDAGLSCEMVVTNIVSTENHRDYDLLSLARSLGIKYYRTGGLRYDENIPAMTSVDKYRDQLAALAGWNKEIGITGMFQNHSGEKRFGAAVWDLYLVLKDLDPDSMGCQFDIRHAATDGGLMWPDSFRLIKPYIRSIILKDFKWAMVDGKWQFFSTPIGQGMVEFSRYFRMLKDAGVIYPVSVHYEYDLGGAEKGKNSPTRPTSEILAAIKQDVDTVNSLWNGA